MYRRLKIIIAFNLIFATLFTGVGVVVGQSMDNVIKTFGDYHVEINEVVDNKINKLFEHFSQWSADDVLTNQDLLASTIEKLSPPAEVNLSACEDNLSSTCLTTEINYRYRNMSEAVTGSLESLAGSVEEGVSLTTLSGVSDTKSRFILDELRNARDASEQAVEFYKQLLFAYPLHFQLEINAEQLQEFLGELKAANRQFEQYPSKFHNASTTQCL